MNTFDAQEMAAILTLHEYLLELLLIDRAYARPEPTPAAAIDTIIETARRAAPLPPAGDPASPEEIEALRSLYAEHLERFSRKLRDRFAGVEARIQAGRPPER